jgi:hypothetical protein
LAPEKEENEPATHSAQDAIPLAKVPAGHDDTSYSQAAAPLVLYKPVVQGRQAPEELLPGLGLYRPASQLAHVPAPLTVATEVENRPALHSVQLALKGEEKLPAPQRSQKALGPEPRLE